MYTYEMMSAVAQRSGGVITFNTMYLSIYRLQDRGCIREQGQVVSEDNRTRGDFAITPEGEAYLDRLESKQADELMDPFSAQYALEEEACFRHGFRLAGRLLGESFSAGS